MFSLYSLSHTPLFILPSPFLFARILKSSVLAYYYNYKPELIPMKKLLLVASLLLAVQVSFAQLNISLLGHLTYSGTTANIGGYVDHSGNEYALVGWQNGLDIVDVTVPTNPVVKFFISGPVSEWREVKTYRDYAYVTTENGSVGLQIINLSNLPASISTTYYKGDSSIANQITTIHALHIDTAKAMLYLYGSNISTGANDNGYPLFI